LCYAKQALIPKLRDLLELIPGMIIGYEKSSIKVIFLNIDCSILPLIVLFGFIFNEL